MSKKLVLLFFDGMVVFYEVKGAFGGDFVVEIVKRVADEEVIIYCRRTLMF